MIRTMIVDDEPLALERIRMLVKDISDIEVVAVCRNGKEAFEEIQRLHPDLVFLDIQMPEVNGFQLLEQLGPERIPVTIFVTAYEQYAIRAFDVCALDYLLKPFDRERFRRALSRARSELERRRSGQVNDKLLKLLNEMQQSQAYVEKLMIRSAGRVFFLRCDELDWIEAAGNYVRLHAGREEYLYRETMAKLESQLNPEHFARVHRSTIVNVDRIKEMQPWFRGDYVIVLKDNRKLTLSRSFRDRLKL